MKKHGAATLGNEGDPGASCIGRAAERLSVAGYGQHAAVGPKLAEEDPRQFELPAAHEAVNAEHFAGAHIERDVVKGAGERQPARAQHYRPISAISCA